MGFYDYRCMISGVSLKGADAVAVAVHPAENGYRPLSLGVTGQYDRFGSVDGVLEDRGTEVLAEYFLARLRDGRFAVDPSWIGLSRTNERLHIEDLFQSFERNYGALETVDAAVATLDGTPIFLALIARAVWDAFAESDAEAAEDDLTQVFRSSPIATEIYGPHRADLAPQLRRLRTVDEFLTANGLHWAPECDPNQRYAEKPGTQHFSDDLRGFLEQAELDYAEVPVMRRALAAYAESIRDLLDDE
ncbi:hypothetical protein [Nocardia arthritidis]|uniref:Uncharacterized protein n=1 Tax=Nocardia arthritidis TaxID=228602 RepID=A0A6G9YMB0_9NOCA|nr:hypothetical protein [Nocardia arthritidis]QIS14321.1 hypothetical protein F5544_32420 [Nocardia arthritidis]